MLSFRGIPEDEELKPGAVASSPTTFSTAIPRKMEVEEALRTVQAQRPDAEVRILNRRRPKRDA